MSPSLLRTLLCVIVLAAWSAVAVRAQSPEVEARLDSIFAQYDNTRSPGCAVGVIQDGAFVFRRGYGMANLEHGIPLTSATIFRIGSTSKQFTAAAMHLLAEDGVIALDDDIRTLFPEFPEYNRPITVRRLLHHTSGLRDYLVLMALAGKRDDDFYTDDDVVEALARQQDLNFLPGDEHLYSNSGYFLMSQIVKRTTGKTLRAYAEEHLFGPLGMDHTHFHDDHTEIVPRRAAGYAPSEDGGFVISMTTLDMVGDGGVFTSVDDLLHWDRHFYEPKIGGPAFWTNMLKRGILTNGDTLTYASGLGHGTYRGLKTISHGGAFVGFRAQMLRFPDERTSIICLCNLSTTSPSRLALRVADVVLADKLAPPETEGDDDETETDEPAPEPPLLTRDQLAAYAGAYYCDELDATYRIRLEEDRLRLHVGNFLDGTLEATAAGVFTSRRLTLRFAEDAGGFLLDAGRVKNLRCTRAND